MAKQVTIKQIAQLAGVSPGTVDRVLHNRGKVSQDNLDRVGRVLADLGYRSNIHTSAISLKKGFRIVISLPATAEGGYWHSIVSGIRRAVEEYSDIDIDCLFRTYNQYDINSCRSAFAQVLRDGADAVVLGPTFDRETIDLCASLDSKGIPYVFVDTLIRGTKPVATFSADQHMCGVTMARLTDVFNHGSGEIAIFNARRVGNMESHNSVEREKGFTEYLKGAGRYDMLKYGSFSPQDTASNVLELRRFLEDNPAVTAIAVLNSRGHVIADTLKEIGRSDILVSCFDTTQDNIRCLSDGSIAFLLCQQPEEQGFSALQALISFMLYRKREENPDTTFRIDILLKENWQ